MEAAAWIDLLHGGHAEEEGAFLGTDFAIVASTAMHALGALGWVLGTAMWVVWRRTLWEGHNARTVRRAADVTTLVAVLLNLVGGTMRIFQPGHPGLEEIGSDPWVQLIFGKHVLLAVSAALSAWLHLRIGPALLASFQAGRPVEGLERLGRLVPWLVLALTGLVALLGASSTVAL